MVTIIHLFVIRLWVLTSYFQQYFSYIMELVSSMKLIREAYLPILTLFSKPMLQRLQSVTFKHFFFHNLNSMYTHNLDNWCNDMYLLCIDLYTHNLDNWCNDMYLLCIDLNNQYKVNTYHYINYQDYGCTLNSNYGKKNV